MTTIFIHLCRAKRGTNSYIELTLNKRKEATLCVASFLLDLLIT